MNRAIFPRLACINVLLLSALAQSVNTAPQPPTSAVSAMEEPVYGVIHGTVDVVIATKEGFVLATDSRGTHQAGGQPTYTDDVQKLFAIGGRTACVIAGLVGAEIGSDGFELRDAIGTSLNLLDKTARNGGSTVDALAVARSFSGGLERVSGLMNPHTVGLPSLVAELSTVSFGRDGNPQWISFTLPLQMRFVPSGGTYLSAGTPIYSPHNTYLGARFDVEVLGQPDVAYRLLGATTPSADKHSRSAIMRRYYLLKKTRRLDDLSLREGVILARELVQATIDLAPQAAGVGGPIDIATVTRSGVQWIKRKATVAVLPPPNPRVFGSSLRGSPQQLDGFQCVRCDFTDSRLFFAGTGDVELVDSTFGGTCRLAIAPHAKTTMPKVVEKLRRLVQGKCVIVEQDSNYP